MTYDVTWQQLPLDAVFDLKGAAEALADWCGVTLPPFPAAPNTRSAQEPRTLAHIGPDHWLLRAPLMEEGTLTEALRPEAAPPEISVVRISDTLATFRITGPDAAEVISIASPLDIHESVFGPDAITFTEAFGLKALVTRCAGGFDLSVEQSFTAMMRDYLTRAVE